MALLKSSAQQRQVLILGFTLLFSASLVIILFERVQKQETANLANTKANLAANEVRGDEIIRDQAIALYHGQARQISTLLFANIDRLQQGQAASADELKAARQAIISMSVPNIYQKLHFRLLRTLNSLEASGPVDLDYLAEQRSLLQEEFPWL